MTRKGRLTTMMAKIDMIADEYTGYWPLTEKQVYYLCLKEGNPEGEPVDMEDLYSIMKGGIPVAWIPMPLSTVSRA